MQTTGKDAVLTTRRYA